MKINWTDICIEAFGEGSSGFDYPLDITYNKEELGKIKQAITKLYGHN